MNKISEEYSSVREALTVYGSISGNYSFRKQRTIWFESTLERDFLLKQDYDPLVIDVVAQPIRIPYVTRFGNESTYTPDFLVQYVGASDSPDQVSCVPLLVEIKPRKKIIQNWSQLKPKFVAAKKFAAERKWKFKIIDESRLYDQYWKNLLVLKKFKRSVVDENTKNILLTILKAVGVTTFNELLLSSSFDKQNRKMIEVNIWILIAKKVLACDLNNPLSSDTLIWINQDFSIGEIND